MNFIKDHIISSYDLSDGKLENVLSAACQTNIDFVLKGMANIRRKEILE